MRLEGKPAPFFPFAATTRWNGAGVRVQLMLWQPDALLYSSTLGDRLVA
jgi:hypothetical protein